MKIFVITFALLFVATLSIAAQDAKYNNNGDLTYISGLLSDTTGCEASKLFSGTITKMEPLRGDNADSFEFTLKPAAGKTVKLVATISLDEGAVIVDLENMLQPKRRVKVKARQCGSGGFWTVEEIRKI